MIFRDRRIFMSTSCLLSCLFGSSWKWRWTRCSMWDSVISRTYTERVTFCDFWQRKYQNLNTANYWWRRRMWPHELEGEKSNFQEVLSSRQTIDRLWMLSCCSMDSGCKGRSLRAGWWDLSMIVWMASRAKVAQRSNMTKCLKMWTQWKTPAKCTIVVRIYKK